MDIQDLDFKELFQKPVEEPFFAHHLEGQLSKQELETVVGGSEPVRSLAAPGLAWSIGVGIIGIITICVPHGLPPHYICSAPIPPSS